MTAIPFESLQLTGYDVMIAFAGTIIPPCLRPDEVRLVDSEIAYLVAYPCLRCGALLEAHTDDWQDWLQCPSCGRAGRPPLNRRMARPVEEDVLYIGTFETGPSTRPDHGNSTALGYPPGGFAGYDAPPSNARRMILGGGFFLAVVLTLVSVVQKNGSQAGVLALVAAFLLVLLARSSGQR